jgi:hypothetical protein
MLCAGRPTDLCLKDWANPTTRKLIHVYPEIPEDGIIREIWHAQKWRKDMDLEILSPMFAAGVSHYYVNEVARVRDGNLVIPIRWVKFRDKIYADTFSVIFNEQVCIFLHEHCWTSDNFLRARPLLSIRRRNSSARIL